MPAVPSRRSTPGSASETRATTTGLPDRRPISPLIYGVNFGSDAQAADLQWLRAVTAERLYGEDLGSARDAKQIDVFAALLFGISDAELKAKTAEFKQAK